MSLTKTIEMAVGELPLHDEIGKQHKALEENLREAIAAGIINLPGHTIEVVDSAGNFTYYGTSVRLVVTDVTDGTAFNVDCYFHFDHGKATLHTVTSENEMPEDWFPQYDDMIAFMDGMRNHTVGERDLLAERFFRNSPIEYNGFTVVDTNVDHYLFHATHAGTSIVMIYRGAHEFKVPSMTYKAVSGKRMVALGFDVGIDGGGDEAYGITIHALPGVVSAVDEKCEIDDAVREAVDLTIETEGATYLWANGEPIAPFVHNDYQETRTVYRCYEPDEVDKLSGEGDCNG